MLAAAQCGHRCDERDAKRIYSHLAVYCSVNVVTFEDQPLWGQLNEVAAKPDTIYYNPRHQIANGLYVDAWFELRKMETS